MLSPFECLCGNFILPEPASYVFFYALFNLHNLLYIINPFISKNVDKVSPFALSQSSAISSVSVFQTDENGGNAVVRNANEDFLIISPKSWPKQPLPNGVFSEREGGTLPHCKGGGTA